MAARDPRVLPQNIEAEQAILGSMLVSTAACETAVEILEDSDFYRKEHRIIFDVLKSMIVRDVPIDTITVQEELRKRGELEQVGALDYLLTLVDSVALGDNVEYYADIVADKSTLRKLITAGTEIVAMAYDQEEEVRDIAETAEKKIFEISEQKNRDTLQNIRTAVMNYYRFQMARSAVEGGSGVKTGFGELDDITSGLQPSNLIIVAARPSMGKTAFALDMALNAAFKEKKTVALFSLEMSTEEVIQRIISSRARIDMRKLRSVKLNDSEYERMTEVSNRLYETGNFYIDDSTEQSPVGIRSKCRRVAAQAKGLDLIVVDYLQLMKTDGKKGDKQREQEVSEVVRGLKALAREMKCPVVALAQLNRNVESRPDKRPLISDLRESGSIEADADIVIMLHRPAYYDKKNRPDSDTEADAPDEVEEANIIIGKHRNGATGTITLGFISRFATFCNYAEEYSRE